MNTKELLKHHELYLAGAAVGGAAVGSAVTFVVTRKVLKARYVAKFEEIIQSELQAYRRANKIGEYSSPEEAAAVLIGDDGETMMTAEVQGDENLYGNEEAQRRALQELRARLTDGDLPYGDPGTDGEVTEQEEAEVKVSISQNAFDTYENPLPRSPEFPYVISVAEFMANDTEYDQFQLTYWADGVLTAENESIIDDIEETVGQENLDLLGSIEANILSEDNNIIYIRNEKRGTDYEVARDNNRYAVIVAGARPGDLEEPGERVVKRFRDGRNS